MTKWKDQLPEYEPRKDSWDNLESSLDFEQQLGRSLADLPRYQPREESWNRIERGLAHRRRPVIRYLTAAAAAAILLLAGIFLLPEKDRRKDKPGKQIVQQPFTPSSPAGNVTAQPKEGAAEETAGSNPPEHEWKPKMPPKFEPDSSTPAPPGSNSPEHEWKPETGNTKLATSSTPAPASGDAPISTGKLAARNSREPATGSARESETILSSDEKTAEAAETPELLAGSGIQGEVSVLRNASEDPSGFPPIAADAGSKEQAPAKGHHRVIRIQWKKQKTQVSLASLPGNSRRPHEYSAEQKQHNGTTLIKIEL
ncbi:hypothetical protein EDD80_10997 [Anseongella ginsenosidimutans]|uniref:Uncharacterized protein n=1 Tax=Anseongella ginsenosidimutans TaxID=496056 RepID=A0A4R3KR58_9SPHI|nr:hypothetical protein [Anseongella ginsenosidimutans]QEC53682.1 hypothetical protein FRZ59_15950 [Anseongella ginsenosidimutans]TCS86068.1 hypothetical protein EDD80_10997 [Anseongella ginsenosidimutans]